MREPNFEAKNCGSLRLCQPAALPRTLNPERPRLTLNLPKPQTKPEQNNLNNQDHQRTREEGPDEVAQNKELKQKPGHALKILQPNTEMFLD